MKRFALAIGTAVLVFAVAVKAQTVIGTISSPLASRWDDIVLYERGGKLFISDITNAQILVYDARTLDYRDAISLSAFLPDCPQSLALHEGTGTLYACVDLGYATSDSTIVIIDADTLGIKDTITDIGWDASIIVDEDRARLYVFGYDIWTGDTLTAFDVNANSLIGSLSVGDLMGDGLISFSSKRGLNPVTGELFFANLHYDKFVVVDGPSLTGELIWASGSRGWGHGATWNPHENKIYITTGSWSGYFVYDRDTGKSTVAACLNDGTSLFYSPAKNRVYSGAEINRDTTVIEGDTDACQNVAVEETALAEVGFVNATHHAYFAGAHKIRVLDEDTLTFVDTIPGCRPDASGWVDSLIVVSQSHRRVYVLSYWNYTEEGSCVLVIDDKEDDFVGTWDGKGVYFRNSETGKYTKLASPAELIALGDLDGDGFDDLIGILQGQAGVWVRYSKTGTWAKVSATAKLIAAGDMNGDVREDLLGSWDGQGVYYKDSIGGTWVKMATPATLMTSGDLDGDNKDDLIGIWPTQSGVWVKFSKSAKWARLCTAARDIATGDMNGDGRVDLVGTWDGQGVYYRDTKSGAWVKMSVPGERVTAGDLDGDGKDDLIGLWTSQGGIWVKYSKTNKWSKLSSPAKDIDAGLMKGVIWGSSRFGLIPLDGLQEGYAEGRASLSKYKDLSSGGPGSLRFAALEEKNLVPQMTKSITMTAGPGEPGFKWTEQKNLVPQQSTETKAARGPGKKQQRNREKESKYK